jgi:hypothetical protein
LSISVYERKDHIILAIRPAIIHVATFFTMS